MIPAFLFLLAAYSIMWLWIKKFNSPEFYSVSDRYSSIDGLRGYLALMVFLHHSCTWYFYVHTGTWKVPPSNIYTNFGEGGVAIFFMVTGFLFFSKLIRSVDSGLDWGRLFISRFMRLAPLYIFATCMVFVIVFYMSGGVLRSEPGKLLGGMLRWLCLGVFSVPDLNGIEQSWMMVAGVTWSLRYEWLFYFALPAFAFVLRVAVPVKYLIVGCLGLIFLLASAFRDERIYCLTLFACGAVSALLVHLKFLKKISNSWPASCLVALLFAVAFLGFESTYRIVPIVLLAVAFLLVASGNSLFGLFDAPVSKALGELSYGIYLLHGLVLFVGLKLLIGIDVLRGFSVIEFWLTVVVLVPVVVIFGIFVFKYIEKPGMNAVPFVIGKIRSYSGDRRNAVV